MLQLILIIVTLFVYVAYGVFNANNLIVKEIDLVSTKITNSIKFVQITDVHIGSEPPQFLEEIVDKINTIDKDFVVITGDLIDSENIQHDDLKSLNMINVPVYFVIGNHEIIAEKEIEFFKQFNITVLNNEKTTFNSELDIIGINFYNPDGSHNKVNVGKILDKIEIHTLKYNILLNHEPDQINHVADKKIDLQLSGHTHNGQIWPFNYFLGLLYDYTYGLYQISEDTSLYVSCGVGIWGPNIRIGSKNEIIVFTVKSINQ